MRYIEHICTCMHPTVYNVSFYTEGADYSPISRLQVDLTNRTPPSGSCVSIPLINDDQLEDDEMFTLSLFSTIGDTTVSSDANGTDITIIDDDGMSIHTVINGALLSF